MTYTGGFSSDNDFAEPSYPTAFGVTFTPTIQGVLVGVVGVGLAAYLGSLLIGPAFGKFQETGTRVVSKELSLEQKAETARRVNEIVANVNQAKAENSEVRGLFSSQESLDTLLLDLNQLIVGTNAQLLKFTPEYGLSGVVQDSSVGEVLNNKLKRQVTSVAFEGNFAQTLTVMQAIDRLQTVLVVRDLSVELPGSNGPQSDKPNNLVKSTFKLYAYVPLTPEEAAAAAAAAAAAKPAEGAPAAPPPAGAAPQ
ncbi:MAG: pilus assembly protein PilO [Thermosynechococcaceae cyanobacterium]